MTVDENMDEFPDFMKNPANLISTKSQFSPGIEGYVFDGADGSQMAFWTAYADRISQEHQHPFDEYLVCVAGQYTAILDGSEIVLNPGDELFIPKGTVLSGSCMAGTRTIHAFGGKRIK